MRAKRKKAVALTTASTNEQHSEAYQNPVIVSRAKLQIGELLLALQAPLSQEQRERYWQLFESMLRQYLDLRVREVEL